MTATYLNEVISRYGIPRIDCFAPDKFRVWIVGRYHAHDGPSSSDLVGYGSTIEVAAQRLIAHTVRSGVVVVEGSCSDDCHNRYQRSHQADIAAKDFREWVMNRGESKR